VIWDKGSWDRHLRNARSAFHKRDVLLDAGCRPDRGTAEGDRDCRAWAAKARANLSRLAQLARAAPDPEGAWAIVEDLRRRHQRPERATTGPEQKVDHPTRVCDYHG
jgi:hypothetical protein